jgi:hypothetical protein
MRLPILDSNRAGGEVHPKKRPSYRLEIDANHREKHVKMRSPIKRDDFFIDCRSSSQTGQDVKSTRRGKAFHRLEIGWK